MRDVPMEKLLRAAAKILLWPIGNTAVHARLAN